jgi:EpsI family protein
MALYAQQSEGHEASGFGQGALPLASRWAWERPGPAFPPAKSEVIQAPFEGPHPERRLCLTWYRSGALLTGSNLALRLHGMIDHLLLRREATLVVIVSASDRSNADPARALAAFLADAGPLPHWIKA